MVKSVGFCSDFGPRQKNRNGSRVLNTFRQKYVSRSSFEASESFTFLASRSGFTGVRQTCFKTRVGSTFAPLGRCARFLEDSSILRVFGTPWTTNLRFRRLFQCFLASFARLRRIRRHGICVSLDNSRVFCVTRLYRKPPWGFSASFAVVRQRGSARQSSR